MRVTWGRIPRVAMAWHVRLALAGLALLGACSSSSTNAIQSSADVGGSGSQVLRAALADGRVTFDEYEAGFLRFKDCMANAGYPLKEVRFDQSTQLYLYVTTGNGTADGCYSSDFEPLDMAWQGNRDRPGNIDVKVLSWYHDCLVEAGVSVDGVAEEGYLALMEQNGVDVGQCVQSHGG
jgi:hypothetical protein